MEKFFIKNRKGQKIVGVVEKSDKPSGLAFIMHGLQGFKEQKHIKAIAEAFKETGYTVVRFDTTNALGESDGKVDDVTLTQSYKDLEDVIKWARSQPWYEEPFALSGHSLGSFCITYYAQNHPEKVRLIVPASPIISGRLRHSTWDKKKLKKWKDMGYQDRQSKSKPGARWRIKWAFMVDLLAYDLLPNAHKLTMPVLIIVGEKDTGAPPKHQQKLYDLLSGEKQMYIVKGSGHTFRQEKELKEIKRVIIDFLDRIDLFSK